LISDSKHPIADAHYRETVFVDIGQRQRRPRVINAGWSSREDKTPRVKRSYFLPRRIARHKFTINMAFPYPSSNEHAVLRAKVEYHYSFPLAWG
jgi:hypothetical protein